MVGVRRRPICPSVGSGCDTRLRVENGSQSATDSPQEKFVTKITSSRSEVGTEDGNIFVKYFAKPQNPSNSAPFLLRDGTKGAPCLAARGTLKRAPRTDMGLARMLREMSITMFGTSSSTMPMSQASRRSAPSIDGNTSGALRASSFFCFLCESFHKYVGTNCRPLRGGKEGSGCRVM